MRRALLISMLLNLLLAGWITWFSLQPRTVDSTEPTNQPAPNDRNLPQSIPTQPQTEQRFRWSQLESTDYRQYIANLKAIGCPHQTIRDIITADVHSLYVGRGEKLNGESMPAQTRAAKLQVLHEEEGAVLAALLGPPPGSPSARALRSQSQNNNVSVPLAFRPADLSALDLNQEQIESIQYLRDAFQRKLRDSSYDRASPEYRQQWQSAQAQNDLMLRGMLGTKLYEQIESTLQSSPNNPR